MSKRFLDKERQLLVEVYDTDEIVANPTLDGTEDSLAGLQIGDTKYKVTGGGGGGVDAYELKITDFTPTATEGEYQLSPELIAVVNEYKRPIYVSSQILTIFGLTSIAQMMAYPTSEIPVLGGKHYSSLVLFDTEITGEVGESQTGFSLYQVNGDVYRIIFPQAQTIVKANETLSGGEETLTSLRIGNGLYKVPQGGGGGSDYTAGDGVQINNDVISVDRESVQKKLVAGDNIEINPAYVGDPYFEQIGSENWPDMEGIYIWTDGKNIYHSYGSNRQYVLDKATSTWTQKTWSGYTNIVGNCIWTDGENIYLSWGSSQYVLDKASSTWTQKTWSGIDTTDFNGYSIWTDGENIYYSSGSSEQYVLDKATSTWIQKTWSGYTDLYGNGIWTDGENFYYSKGSNQYVLDKPTSTWVQKNWTGYTYFDGNYIWTDGKNIYYSSGLNQYVLNKKTSTWLSQDWGANKPYSGYNIWTDGDNIYYSGTYTSSVIAPGSYILTKGEVNPNAEEISFSSSLTEQDIKDLFSKYLDSNASFVEYTDPDTGETNYILNIPRNASYEENATGYTLVVDTDDADLDDNTASFGEK